MIICPNSVKPVWEADLALYGDDPETTWIFNRKKRPNERPRNVIINYESIWRTDLLEYEWDSIIFDESQRLGNFRTKQFEFLFQNMEYLEKAKVILLSGTPYPEGSHQLIAQSILAIGNYDGYPDPYTAIRAGWLYDERTYKWKPDRGTDKRAKEILHILGEAMTRQEAGILTGKLYRRIRVKLSADEINMCREYFKLSPDIGPAQALLAYQSFASGRPMVTEGSEDLMTLKSSKLDAVVEYAAEHQEQVVIFANFQASIRYLEDKLRAKDIVTESIHGKDGGAEQRAEILDYFKHGVVKVLIAQVSVAKVGLNLSAASTIIFAENSFSGEARIQAEERCTVKGKENVEIIDFLAEVGSAILPGSNLDRLDMIDERILETVRDKKDFNIQALQRPRG